MTRSKSLIRPMADETLSISKQNLKKLRTEPGRGLFLCRVMVYSFRIISGIMKTKDVEPWTHWTKRREIDTVDAALAALFERRMAAVLAVAEYKKAHGLPIFGRPARGSRGAGQIKAAHSGPRPAPYADHVQHMMDVAKQYRPRCWAGTAPPIRAWRALCAHRAQGALPPCEERSATPPGTRSSTRWNGVQPMAWSPLRTAAARACVRRAGPVPNHPALWVVDVYDLPISQNLLVLPGTR